ncbi:MAG: hypothetical protein ACOX2O_07105 [Bdellovibrionota bacterium]|jgi:hypothetical protein
MRKILVIFILMTSLCACSGVAHLSTPAAPQGRPVLSCQASTSAFMLFNFAPIAYNDMLERAFNECAGSIGASALTNISVREKWYWTPVGNGFITTVTAQGVR